MSLLYKGLFSHKDAGLLLFRLLMGLLIMYHGYLKFAGGAPMLEGVGSALKMFGVTSGFYMFGFFAALSEFCGGLLVLLGLFTRLGALAVIGTLVVATLVSLPGGFMAFAHPLEVSVGFLMLLVAGPGKYSIDYKLFGHKQ